MMVDDSTVGALLVETIDRDASAALTSLASEVGLALARVDAASEIQAREARFRSLIANASDVVRVIDASGTIIYESEAVRRVLGYKPGESVGRSAFEHVHPDDLGDLRLAFASLLANPSDGGVAAEARLRHADGSWRHIEGIARNLLDDPAVNGCVLNFRDITDRKLLEAELRHRALHDPLTDLPNRALFHDRVSHALSALARSNTAVAVIFIDLDDFKTVNDSVGHGAGDEVLKVVGARLQASVRPSDTCARFGGDEFALLLERVSGPAEVYDACTRMLDVVRGPIQFEDHTLLVDASVGIVLSSGGESADELIRNADLAMYRAKSTGKGQYQLFESGMHEAIRKRIDLKADLERGIAEQEFVAHYQPIVRLDSAEIVGVEALVRWQHPTQGLLLPSEFLAVAEETGLIVPIGRQVLAQACRDAAAWRSSRGELLSINVNLSARELQDPALHGVLAGILGEHGVDPQRLVVEITESMLMVDTSTAAATLEGLKGLGARVALDDFGTGYSSLTYLQQFPVDVVKIDKSFVESLGDGNRESRLARAVLALGDTLGLDVIAEGVENRRQLDRLHELGCVEVQGYLLSVPVAASDVPAFLATVKMGALAGTVNPSARVASV